MCGGTCEYVAEKDEPEKWHGEYPSEWFLDRDAEGCGLDIERWRCPHPKLGETDYCVFHTDPEDLPKNVDESEEIIEALEEAGESPFDDGPEHRGQFVGATFGPIDLSGERIAAGQTDVRFDHARFHGGGEKLNFEGTNFVAEGEKPVSFTRSTFIGKNYSNLNFVDTMFKTSDGDVDFQSATFKTDDGDVDFQNATFETGGGKGDVNFQNATFETGGGKGDVDFQSATFETGEGKGDVDFRYATFETGEGKSGINFRYATFETGDGKSGINFRNSTFETGAGNVEFWEATFETGEGEGNVDFRHAIFETGDGTMDFWGTIFKTGDGDVDFQSATFKTRDGVVKFGETTFKTGNGTVDFTNATFKTDDGAVGFVYATFKADDGNVDFTYTTFETGTGEGGVDFSGATFNTSDNEGSVEFKKVTFGTGDGEGDVDFRYAMFETGDNEGYVDFRYATFKTGDGSVYFQHATFGTVSGDRIGLQTEVQQKITDSTDGDFRFKDVEFVGPVRFDNAGVDATVTLIFSGAEFEEEFVYGPDTGIPTLRGCLDFSDVIFEEEPNFLGGRQSIYYDSTEPQTSGLYHAVFVNSVDFSDTQFPEGVDFSDFKFPNDTNFDGAKLSGANFSRADLSGASFERATLNRTEFLGANMQGAHLYGALLGDARVNRKTKFWPEIDDMRYRDVICLSDNPLGGGFYRRFRTKLRRGRIPYCAEDPLYAELNIEGLPQSREVNLEKAAEIYATIEQVAQDNSLPGLASEAFLGRKDVQHREYRQEGRLSMRLRSFVPNLVARYGESPWRVLGTGAIIVLVWGAAYWAFNLIERQSGEADPTLIETIYFSSLTFTTLGYGDFRPRNTVGQVLAVSETAFGVILLAILVFVFGRRATR